MRKPKTELQLFLELVRKMASRGESCTCRKPGENPCHIGDCEYGLCWDSGDHIGCAEG